MKRSITLVVGLGAGLVAIAMAQSALKLMINGKAATQSAIIYKGETYVPLKALQSAGVSSTLSGTTLSLSFPNAGGANQMGANEGKTGDWLFNGIWRFRVASIEKLSGDRAGWKLQVELRNGTKSNEVALNNTGYVGLRLVLDNGNQIEVDNPTDIRDNLIPQAGSKSAELMFYLPEGVTGNPDKLILILTPDADAAKYMKNALGVSYGPAGGTLRIKLSGT